MTIAGEVLWELCRSDADGHVPHWQYLWLTVLFAHIGIGMMVAHSKLRRAASVLLLLYIGKELACDLRHDGFAFWTWVDSAVDVSAICGGFLWASRHSQRSISSPVCGPGSRQSHARP